MTKKTAVHYAVAAAFITASSAASLAFAVDEVEPNNSITSPQALQMTATSITISGVLGTTDLKEGPFGDVDFYSFESGEDSKVTIDIDGGAKLSSSGKWNLDSIVAIFDSDLKIIRQNDDMQALKPDEGSASKNDSLLENVVLPKAGRYIVGVSSRGRFFLHGGGLTSNTLDPKTANGSYTLIISGVNPAMQHITIQIKPGSVHGEDGAPVNPKAKGSIPVALMSSATFDALKVDRASLTFGGKGDERSLVRCDNEGQDIDGDGRVDLVCHFDNQLASFELGGETEGTVKGRSDKGLFEGSGYVRIVGQKKKQD